MSGLLIAGVRNPRSFGVARYTARLAEALAEEQIVYRLEERADPWGQDTLPPGELLARISRRRIAAPDRPSSSRFTTSFRGRVRSLPLYRALAYPRLARSAAVIVHSRFAADMLMREAGRRPARLEVIPYPAQRPSNH